MTQAEGGRERGAPPSAAGGTGRLRSLDVFRGATIAAMILVNNPGDWGNVFSPLLHARWHGCTPTDLIFPFFLFIVGTAMAFSFRRRLEGDGGTIHRKILSRTLILFGLGLLLHLYPSFDFGNLRIMGVLQRIALAYLATSLIVLHLGRCGQVVAVAVILIGYWALLAIVPFPGRDAAAVFDQGRDLGAYLDRLVLTRAHLWRGGEYDPEGLLSTLPAVATVMSGYWSGKVLQCWPRTWRGVSVLTIAGAMAIVGGWLWGLVFPINKQLWTSSYVLLTSGWAMVCLALCHVVFDLREGGISRAVAAPLEAMGRNAILVFVGSGLLVRTLLRLPSPGLFGIETSNAKAWLSEALAAPFEDAQIGSLAHALVMVLLWGIIAWLLHLRRWYLKV